MASRPRDRDRAAQERRRKIASDFARRHPEKARTERELRKAHAAAARDFGHKRNGTIETHQKAAGTHQGALARLFVAGHISIDQLAASQQIRAIFERIARGAAVGTVSLETRVDESRHGQGAFFESLGAVRAEVAYGRWRAWLGRDAGPVLTLIVEDVACSAAARRHGMRGKTLQRLLGRALDGWSELLGEACEEIDEATLLAAQAGLF